MRAKRRLIALSVAIGLIASAGGFAQTPGVTATEIKVGNINPYSGPASAYGTIGKSIGAYFKMVNDQGGINGRKINYISYDDGYSPRRRRSRWRAGWSSRTRSRSSSSRSARRRTAPSTST